jgi:C4-dicarboxylate-specific signal transduction histidine kinase
MHLTNHVTALRATEERRPPEDALRSARVELERVMQMTAMGEMAASIAHEINQPPRSDRRQRQCRPALARGRDARPRRGAGRLETHRRRRILCAAKLPPVMN